MRNEVVSNEERVRELHDEFLRLTHQGKYKEARKVFKELKENKLYQTRRGKGIRK